MESVHSEISVSSLQPHPCFKSLAFLLVSPKKTLFLGPLFLLPIPVKQPVRGCKQQARMCQRLRFPMWTSLFSIPAPHSYTTCFLRRFAAFTRSFYAALGRELAGWDGKDGGGRRGGRNEEGGNKWWGPEEKGSLPLIYYEFSRETASRLESE